MPRAWLGILVACVVSCGGADAAPPAEPQHALAPRQAPTRDDIMRAAHDVQPAVRACGTGAGAIIATRMSFASDGTVVSVEVPPGTPYATCVVEAASHARVPPFRSARFVVTYPFLL